MDAVLIFFGVSPEEAVDYRMTLLIPICFLLFVIPAVIFVFISAYRDQRHKSQKMQQLTNEQILQIFKQFEMMKPDPRYTPNEVALAAKIWNARGGNRFELRNIILDMIESPEDLKRSAAMDLSVDVFPDIYSILIDAGWTPKYNIEEVQTAIRKLRNGEVGEGSINRMIAA